MAGTLGFQAGCLGLQPAPLAPGQMWLLLLLMNQEKRTTGGPECWPNSVPHVFSTSSKGSWGVDRAPWCQAPLSLDNGYLPGTGT